MSKKAKKYIKFNKYEATEVLKNLRIMAIQYASGLNPTDVDGLLANAQKILSFILTR